MLEPADTTLAFDALDGIVGERILAPGYAALFAGALAAARRKAARAMPFPPSDLPLAVAHALEAPEDIRRLCAALGCAVWAGADILDDIADGDGLDWIEPSDPRAVLVATNLLSTFPHLLLAGPLAASLPSDRRVRMSLATAGAILEMSQGQHRDLSSTVSSFEDYLQTVSEKTGAEMALLAALPALALGLPEPEIAAWERFGRGFGMLVQVYTDTCDIVADPPGRDLLGGKRTAPVLHALTVLEGDERASFDVLLAEAANGSEDAARAASRIAVRAGALRAGLTLASYLRVKALAAAPRKPDQDPRCKSLSVLIHSSLPNPHQSGGTR